MMLVVSASFAIFLNRFWNHSVMLFVSPSPVSPFQTASDSTPERSAEIRSTSFWNRFSSSCLSALTSEEPPAASI